jgi:hypothetical protein
METIRRSLTGAAMPAAAGVAVSAAGAACSGEPHSAQNLPDAAGAPHAGHVAASECPHSTQNFAPGWLFAPQLPHVPSATPSSVTKSVVRRR